MYKLVILAIWDPKARKRPYEVKGHFEFETQAQAELRALLYLKYCPNDIVMLHAPDAVVV